MSSESDEESKRGIRVLGLKDFQSVPDPSLLVALDLNDCGLGSLPAELWVCVNLQELNLSCNKLSSLPIEVGNWTSMTNLYLSINEFTALPIEVLESYD
jgi:Leucine-rich repeat (LRR) protein